MYIFIWTFKESKELHTQWINSASIRMYFHVELRQQEPPDVAEGIGGNN